MLIADMAIGIAGATSAMDAEPTLIGCISPKIAITACMVMDCTDAYDSSSSASSAAATGAARDRVEIIVR